MRQLTTSQTVVYAAGGLLMVAGMGCYVFLFRPLWTAALYLVGAVLFAIMQCLQTYHGDNFTVKRLKSIMTMADLLFVVVGILMVDSATRFLRPIFHSAATYYQWVYNKWLVVLLVAVVLELYSINRISYILRKKR